MYLRWPVHHGSLGAASGDVGAGVGECDKLKVGVLVLSTLSLITPLSLSHTHTRAHTHTHTHTRAHTYTQTHKHKHTHTQTHTHKHTRSHTLARARGHTAALPKQGLAAYPLGRGRRDDAWGKRGHVQLPITDHGDAGVLPVAHAAQRACCGCSATATAHGLAGVDPETGSRLSSYKTGFGADAHRRMSLVDVRSAYLCVQCQTCGMGRLPCEARSPAPSCPCMGGSG